MKKLLSLLLASLFVVSTLAGCASSDDEAGKKKEKDKVKGAIVQTYLCALPTSIDPAAVYTTTDTTKLMGLLFEGLTKIDDNGKLVKALAEDWEYEVDERDNYLKLVIDIEHTRWSDGIVVDAEDFIFAWQRLLLPENDNPNASLLYPILNAKEVKKGLVSVNDLGVRAIRDRVLEITFEPEFTDVKYFLRRLASPSLVPLREDIVSRGEEWCTSDGSSWITNGPFKIKAWKDSEFTLERSLYYHAVSDSDSNKLDKVVKPYRLVNLYSEGNDADAQYLRFIGNKDISEEFTNDNKSFYINLNGASKETLDAAGKKVKTAESPSTYAMFFNPENELFKDANVRRALSLAIDRNALVQLAPMELKAATGFVPFGVEDTSKSKDFRKEGGDIISASANLDEAKKLLKEAGVSGGTINIECSNYRDFERDMIELVADAWEELGFEVEVTAPRANYLYNKANGKLPFDQNNVDVICYDLVSKTSDAYSILTTFSGVYGGGFIDVTTGTDASSVVYNANRIGFIDEVYDELCKAFMDAEKVKPRTAAMHEAEEYLASAMPVIPLFFESDVYVYDKLSKVELDFFGRYDLKKLKQSSFKKYLPPEEEKLLAE